MFRISLISILMFYESQFNSNWTWEPIILYIKLTGNKVNVYKHVTMFGLLFSENGYKRIANTYNTMRRLKIQSFRVDE